MLQRRSNESSLFLLLLPSLRHFSLSVEYHRSKLLVLCSGLQVLVGTQSTWQSLTYCHEMHLGRLQHNLHVHASSYLFDGIFRAILCIPICAMTINSIRASTININVTLIFAKMTNFKDYSPKFQDLLC